MTSDSRMRLQWGPKENEELRERVIWLAHVISSRDESLDDMGRLVDDLKVAIRAAPCLVARPGEVTYECNIEDPCRVCQWRREVSEMLVEEWHLPSGIW